MNLLKHPISIKDLINDVIKHKLTSYKQTFPYVKFTSLLLESQNNGILYYRNVSDNKLYGYDYYNEVWVN